MLEHFLHKPVIVSTTEGTLVTGVLVEANLTPSGEINSLLIQSHGYASTWCLVKAWNAVRTGRSST